MKTLLLAASLIASTASLAEEVQLIPVKILSFCGDSTDLMQSHKSKYNEQPIMLGEATLADADGTIVDGSMVFWHGESNDFTITFTPTIDTKVTCYIMAGSLASSEEQL